MTLSLTIQSCEKGRLKLISLERTAQNIHPERPVIKKKFIDIFLGIRAFFLQKP